MKSLYQTLKKEACKESHSFLKYKTPQKAFEQCQRGDWILWAFKKFNPDSIKELTLAKGHCAATVLHLMKDERSRKAVQVAIDYGEGRASKKELADAAYAAYAAAADAAYAAADAAYAAADAAYAAADAAYDAYAAADAAADAAYDADAAYAAYAAADAAYDADAYAYVKNQKQTADICRKYLPLSIWRLKL